MISPFLPLVLTTRWSEKSLSLLTSTVLNFSPALRSTRVLFSVKTLCIPTRTTSLTDLTSSLLTTDERPFP